MKDVIKGTSANAFLDKMKHEHGVDKGVWGERACLRILLDIYRERGGILIHSYEFKVDPTKNGNIKRENGKLFLERLGDSTEIDLLYISQYRVYPIEVKSYDANVIKLTTDGISGCATTHKSPIHQNEMHCNHLYSSIAESINGNPAFIVPIVVFNTFDDRPVIEDQRSERERGYILTTNTGGLKDLILKCDTPLNYRINLDQMERQLRSALVSADSFYPVQWR